jgi:aminoglycoside 3-N-acetyltransferase
MSLLSKVRPQYKLWAKARLNRARGLWVRTFRSYGAPQFLAALRSLGVSPGDTIMVHSSFSGQDGFRGTVDNLIDVLIEAVGPEGNLMMVSLPYRSASADYLARIKKFDVRNTPSMMGLVSEFFRRRGDVVRSLSPSHPVLARGAKARWLIADHSSCLFPCGPGTPFDKLAQLDGIAIFFNVSLSTFTFFHYLEHLVAPNLPFALYSSELYQIPVVDERGETRTVATYAFSRDAIRRRRDYILHQALRKRGALAEGRIGNSRIMAVRVRAAVDCVLEMAREGQYFYDMSGSQSSSPLTSDA